MWNFLFGKTRKFKSKDYWEKRYKSGGNSGAGSYNHLAAFKADVINALIKKNNIQSVIEFGCGDGNQLASLEIPEYIGLDVSETALDICRNKFGYDTKKRFYFYDHSYLLQNRSKFVCDVSMSLDVLYHLVENNVYNEYLEDLFSVSKKMVIIYGADIDLPQQTPHELYRKFSRDIEEKFKDWRLEEFIKNRFPAKNYDDQEGSLADFFIYTKG